MKEETAIDRTHPAVSRYLMHAESLASGSTHGEMRLLMAENHIVLGDAVHVLARLPSNSLHRKSPFVPSGPSVVVRWLTTT